MYGFTKESKEKLNSCHKDIQTIMNKLIEIYDFKILEGLRTTEQQVKYFKDGKSKLDGIIKKSKHQDDGSGKSMAIDIMPYSRDTNAFSGKIKDNARFYFMAGIVFAITEELYEQNLITHKIRWGGDWDSDSLFDDNSFDDLPHFELI